MRTCRRVFVMAGVMLGVIGAISSTNVFAQEGSSPASNAAIANEGETKNRKEWRQKISSDAREIKQDRETNRSHARAATQEDKDLRDQIHQAAQSGDHEKAESLREQLKSAHRENVNERRQDQRDLRQDRQDLRSDVRDARRDGALPPRRFNPPGYNPPGAGPGNPPGYNPPGAGPHRLPPRRAENFRDHRSDQGNRDFRDPGEDRRDGHRDGRDHRKGGDDGRRYFGDSGQDNRDRHENASQGRGQGVRDHGAGEGAGKGQGGMHRHGENKHNAASDRNQQ